MPQAKWWIKADGCDVISSLEESLRLEWNGDVDLGDGKCQALHDAYLKHLNEVAGIGSNIFDDTIRDKSLQCLLKQKDVLKNELIFIHNSKFVE